MLYLSYIFLLSCLIRPTKLTSHFSKGNNALIGSKRISSHHCKITNALINITSFFLKKESLNIECHHNLVNNTFLLVNSLEL